MQELCFALEEYTKEDTENMKLDIEQIKNITQGAEKIRVEDGKFCFSRFTEEEAAVISNANLSYTAGIQMEFKTDGDRLNLKVNTKDETNIRSYFAFDVFVDGILKGYVSNLKDEDCTGDYAVSVYKLGEFSKDFDLGNGEKNVRIVFPHSVKAEIEGLEIENATYVAPLKREKKIVFYGDSITQGYDALHPSKTYAMRLGDAMSAEIINKGIGGAVFDPEFGAVSRVEGADYVVVAYGTNDWTCIGIDSIRASAIGFLTNLEKSYPCIPIYVIAPIWRKDYETDRIGGKFRDIEQMLKDVCANYKNVRFVSGWNLVPHDEMLFGDLSLHPNDKGFEYYCDNLLRLI